MGQDGVSTCLSSFLHSVFFCFEHGILLQQVPERLGVERPTRRFLESDLGRGGCSGDLPRAGFAPGAPEVCPRLLRTVCFHAIYVTM